MKKIEAPDRSIIEFMGESGYFIKAEDFNAFLEDIRINTTEAIRLLKVAVEQTEKVYELMEFYKKKYEDVVGNQSKDS